MERIQNHPVLGLKPERELAAFTYNDTPMTGYRGEPIAAALLAAGVRMLRRHEESGKGRGIYCAIGHCMECRLSVKGKGIVRACLTPLEDGMIVLEGQQLSNEITGRKLP